LRFTKRGECSTVLPDGLRLASYTHSVPVCSHSRTCRTDRDDMDAPKMTLSEKILYYVLAFIAVIFRLKMEVIYDEEEWIDKVEAKVIK
jgi:hypothetical protein